MANETGFTRLLMAEGRVVCYRIRSVDRETVDAWAVDLHKTLTNWQGDTWRLLLDIRLEQGRVPSTYALARSRELAQLRPDLRGRLAVVIGSRLAAQIISFSIHAFDNDYRQRQVFASEASALSWLLEI